MYELLRSAFRICCLRPPASRAGSGTVPAVLLRLAVLLLVQALQGYLLNGEPGHLAWEVLPDQVFPVAVLWLSSWLVAVLADDPMLAGPLLAELLAARALLALLQALALIPAHLHPDDARLDAPTERVLELIQLWWWLAALARISRPFRARRLRAVFALGAFAGPWLLLTAVFPPSDLWQGDNLAEDAVPGVQAMSEAVFHAQPGLFEDAVSGLEGERPGVDDLFYLGLAGDTSTTAFRNEVELAGQLLEERFDTHGHALLLANDAGPAPQHPFATRTNLQDALTQLGEVMDTDDDILLLYLSSHGTREHTLVLSQPALALADLDPAALRAALDNAGIRWRIVVISACFAGGFVDALRDDHTLIITASDADHSSFGCGVSDRYTWFGQAFLDEQLRKTFSFQQAFQAAARSIAEREKLAGEPASNPQMVVGAAMGPKLAALEARLGQPGGPAGSVQAANRLHPRHASACRAAQRRQRWLQAGMSGVSEQASSWISSLRRSLRFFNRRSDSSSMPPSLA